MRLRLKRMWINQPSTLQPDHKYHGLNVLVEQDNNEEYIDAYMQSGPIISMRVALLSLSPGWREG